MRNVHGLHCSHPPSKTSLTSPLSLTLPLLDCAMQHTAPTPGQPVKQPVLIPGRMGLLGPDGVELPLKLRG